MEEEEKIHLGKLKKGQEESFRFIYDLYHTRIYHYCKRFVYDEDLCEEATADVFVKLWEKKEILDDSQIVLPFLFKLAKDISLNYLKKIAANKRLQDTFINQYIKRKEASSEDKFIWKEKLDTLNKVLDALPAKRKAIFRLRYEEEMDYQSIAQKLNISPNTVKVQLVKARKFIKANGNY